MTLTEMTTVLGMHRSGTSLTANLVHELGIPMIGDEWFLRLGNEFNPSGYWETNELVTINNRLLYHLGGDWQTVPRFEPHWWESRSLKGLRIRAEGFLKNTPGPRRSWKDPRLSLTMPFWAPLVPSVRYIVCLRNPLDVAASLAKRDDMDFSKAIKLWALYTARALMVSEGGPRMTVFYEDLLERGRDEVSRIGEFLGIRRAVQDGVNVMRPEYVHSRHTDRDVMEDLRLPDSIREFWAVLKKWQSAGYPEDSRVADMARRIQPDPAPYLVRRKYRLKGWASTVKMRFWEEWTL